MSGIYTVAIYPQLLTITLCIQNYFKGILIVVPFLTNQVTNALTEAVPYCK